MQTIVENVEASSIGNKVGLNEFAHPLNDNNNNNEICTSKNTNSSASLSSGTTTPKTSTSVNNNTSEKSWRNFFGIQQSRQLLRSNSLTSPIVSNNTSSCHSETGVTHITSRLIGINSLIYYYRQFNSSE
ncbi:unnamed protein product [Rotaria sp. Silwood2]|nr:unnamed protein product [Rotaria sp. Silwood2]CAF2790437.1 unnamed protein product [Rotaria sp. Silwood2]CAF4135907.1 unnamed protein product [Rotaria sp. Silwood2]CAF4375069.1 unnamed protein product [Rotaria sp. Silwood2]CAF4381037.1 unnamed protein product [Rotaria sp. Silwood2]